MSSNTVNVQILRSYSTAQPTNLLDGQLAYSFASNTLFIGSNGNHVITVGGLTPLSGIVSSYNTANLAYAQANAAFNTANNSGSGVANSAYNTANAAFIQANLAFAQANTGGQSNTTNAAFNVANLAYTQANAAFAAANAAGSSNNVTAAFNTANLAYAEANAVFVKANNNASNIAIIWTESNSAFNQANASFVVTNSAFTQANSAFNNANAAFIQANSAFAQANVGNTFVNTGGTVNGNVTVSNNLTVSGNLYVLGNLTAINTTQEETNAPLIFLANNNTSSDTVDIGFVGNYNATGNAFTGLFRNPTLKEFIFFQNYASPISSNNLINISDPSFAYANVYSNYFKGNLLSHNVDLFYYSNSAFSVANTASANTVALQGIENAQNTNIAYSWTTANAAFANANSAILYQTTISNSVNSIAVGGAPIQNAQTWSTFTVSQVFDAILFPTIGPTYTIPTISLSGTASGTVEVGSTITQTMTLTGTKNDASAFLALYIQRNSSNIATISNPSGTATTNIASQYGYSDPNNQNYYYTLSNTDTATATTGTFTWSGYGNYGAGVAKLTNKGQTDANGAQVRSTVYPQAASTGFASGSYSVTGIYPYFWGVSSTQPTAASIASAIQAGTANKVLAVGSGTLTITFNASSQYVWLAVQNSYATKTTWYNTALNNGSIGAGQFILSPVIQAVTSPTSLWSGVNYNMYISGYSTTTSGSIQFS
jgi:hypothetical protein